MVNDYERPPYLFGDAESKIDQLVRYMYRLAETLNDNRAWYLNNIEDTRSGIDAAKKSIQELSGRIDRINQEIQNSGRESEITDETDMNNLLTNAKYKIQIDTSTMSHLPSSLVTGDVVIIEIIGIIDSLIIQRITNGDGQHIYTRSYDGTNWTSWYEFEGIQV